MTGTEDRPLLLASDIVKSFPAGDGSLAVLRGVSLQVGAGHSVAVTGPSGSGKSTLLSVLGTLDHPDEGRVLIEGEDVSSLPPRALALLRNRKIGFVFQLHHLLPHLTTLENALVPNLAFGGRADVARAKDLLRRVGMEGRIDARPAQLSGGERQRAAVVRALMNRPRLLLADEPTGSLDREAARSLADLLVGLNRQEGVALVVATHSAELASRMDRVVSLQDGRLTERAATR